MILWIFPPLEVKARPLTDHITGNYSDTVAYGLPTPTTEAARAIYLSYNASNAHLGRGNNCVSTLKQAGLLPNKKVTTNGLAKTIPTKPLELKDGEKAVIKTKEGWTGHVVYVQKRGDKYISIVEGGYVNGVGREVPPSVIVGQVAL